MITTAVDVNTKQDGFCMCFKFSTRRVISKISVKKFWKTLKFIRKF